MPAADRRVQSTACAAPLLVLASCAGNPPLQHDAGSTFVEARVHHGVPILQRSFFWDGNGEVDETGAAVRAGSYLTDTLAIGAGTGAAAWWTSGSDVFSVELEGLLRVRPWHDCPVYFDGTGGYLLATDQIPPGGTVWNFTFGFGGGVELPLARTTALVAGADYHHVSNALGRDSERNPSENAVRMYVGVEWTF
jgi:hypothetical protein